MYSSSAPASNKSTSIDRDTKARTRTRRSTQTKVDYRRANDRGLESHASFRI